ncbi:MAG: Lpg1974 family pore-forming outer membrane protein [Gammaproteobacteria bacterium]
MGLIALGLASGSALAGHPATNVPLPKAHNVLVTVPEQDGRWDLGLELLVWQPNNSDLQYDLQRSQEAGSSLTRSYFKTKEVGSDYEWGFRVDGTYHMPVQGKDVEIDWVHFSDDNVHERSHALRLGDGNSFAVNLPWDYLNPTVGNNEQPFDRVDAVQEYDYDHFDATFGQKMRVGRRVMLRPYAGARFTDMHAKNNIAAVSNGTSDDIVERWRFRTSYKGIGPRIGMDGDVELGYRIGAFVRGGVSLLVGDQGFSHLQDRTASNGSQIVYKHDVSDIVRVVPEADIRLGFHYGFDFNHQLGMNVELGYEAENYFDVLNKSYLASFDSANGSTNFGWNGPYARLQLNIA